MTAHPNNLSGDGQLQGEPNFRSALSPWKDNRANGLEAGPQEQRGKAMKAITERELRDCLGQSRRSIKPGDTGEGWDKALDALDIDYAYAAEKISSFFQHRWRCKQGVIGCDLGTRSHLHGLL